MEVRAKKSLGQHFLTDQDIARAIVDALAVAEQDADGRRTAVPDAAGPAAGSGPAEWRATPVLEVGPGMGVLTQYLLQRPELDLTAVELDGESVEYLRKHFPALEGRLLQEDFLRMNLERRFPGSFRIIGNFPYNISSQIFFKVLEHRDRIPEVVCMIQKEVADRIAEKPGTKTYGILSVLLQAWYDIEYLFPVGPGAFAPPPKVQSAVIRLRRNGRQSLGCDEKLFKALVKTSFGQRRKTLRNSLRPLVAQKFLPGTAEYVRFLSEPVFDLRPERLSVEDFVALTNRLLTYDQMNNQ